MRPGFECLHAFRILPRPFLHSSRGGASSNDSREIISREIIYLKKKCKFKRILFPLKLLCSSSSLILTKVIKFLASGRRRKNRLVLRWIDKAWIFFVSFAFSKSELYCRKKFKYCVKLSYVFVIQCRQERMIFLYDTDGCYEISRIVRKQTVDGDCGIASSAENYF